MKRTGDQILKHLRAALVSNSVDALLIPSSDAHNSEYVAESLQRREYVSNFTGSAGNVLITAQKALLWTDGRYWLQAANTLYPGYELMKQGELGVPSWEEWARRQLGREVSVGVDPFLITVAEWERLSKVVKLVPVQDVVGPLMAEERQQQAGKPSVDPPPVYIRPQQFCGKPCKAKRDEIVEELKKKQCDTLILSALDEVAWLTNLRGSAVPCNPVFYAYAIVTAAEPTVIVFTDPDTVSQRVRAATRDELTFYPYTDFPAYLQKLMQGDAKHRVLLDVLQTSKAVYSLLVDAALGVGCNAVVAAHDESAVVERTVCGPAQRLKAIKSAEELQGFRDCHVRDGVALTQYLAWLHEEIAVKNRTDLNEWDAASELERLRATNKHFIQLSFPSISSTGPNAAIIHYSPSSTESSVIRKDQLYLIDSGAQYWDGTTDVTRTVCFSKPATAEEEEEVMEAYTLVLKGHIRLNSAVFPKGTTGHRLDALARLDLWHVGLNYSHGTGHGVGSFLCVHEGPHGVGVLPVKTNAYLEAGMTVSNEPGFYKNGKFGIRIENVDEILVKPLKHSKDGFLGFSSLTVAPLCRELIAVDLLTSEEKAWVNGYHQRVLEVLSPELEARGDQRALAYLKHHTQPIV